MAAAARLLRREVLYALFWCALVNGVVHSLFWASLPWIAAVFAARPLSGLWLAEAVVACIEGAIYWRVLRLGVVAALLLSVSLNLASWWLGGRLLLWLV
jgi:hypothetical protein